MPQSLISSALRLMPKLMAEDSLLAFQEYAVGSGTLTPDARRRILDRWQRQAGDGAGTSTGLRLDRATPDQLASMGFSVEIVERPK